MGRLGIPEEIALECLYLVTGTTYSTGLNLYASSGCELNYGLKANIQQFHVWYNNFSNNTKFVKYFLCKKLYELLSLEYVYSNIL